MKKGLIMEGGAMRGMFTAGVIDVLMEHGIVFDGAIGYNRNVVILTQPLHFRKKPDTLLPLMKLYYRKFPNLVKRIATRHLQYNASLDYIARRETAGELLVIRPPEKLPIGRTERDPEKLRQVYEIGRQTATARIEEIQKYLKEEL